MRQRRILAVGYLSIDTIETPAGRFERVPGGAALYAALGVRHAGALAGVVAAVGNDYPIHWLDVLAQMGIDISRVERRPGPTRTARLQHSAGGKRLSPLHGDDVWWQRTLARSPPPLGDLGDVDGLVAGPMPVDALSAVIHQAARQKLHVIADTSEAFAIHAAARLLDLVSQLAAFAPSREETRLLLPGVTDDMAASSLAERGMHVLQKRGADGAWAVSAGGGPGIHMPAPPAVVIDPTGAGDATVGALAAHLFSAQSFMVAATAALSTGAVAVSGIGPAALGLSTSVNFDLSHQEKHGLHRH